MQRGEFNASHDALGIGPYRRRVVRGGNDPIEGRSGVAGRHAAYKSAADGRIGVFDAVNEILLQVVPDRRSLKIVEEASDAGSFDGRMHFGKTHEKRSREEGVRPVPIAQGDELQQHIDIVRFQNHNFLYSRNAKMASGKLSIALGNHAKHRIEQLDRQALLIIQAVKKRSVTARNKAHAIEFAERGRMDADMAPHALSPPRCFRSTGPCRVRCSPMREIIAIITRQAKSRKRAAFAMEAPGLPEG